MKIQFKGMILALLCCGFSHAEDEAISHQKEILTHIEPIIEQALTQLNNTNGINLNLDNIKEIPFGKMHEILIKGKAKDVDVNGILSLVSSYRYLLNQDREFILSYHRETGSMPYIYMYYASNYLRCESRSEEEFWCQLAIDTIESNPDEFNFMCIKLLSHHADIDFVKDVLVWLPIDVQSSMYKFRALDTTGKNDLSNYDSIHEWYLDKVIRANNLEKEYDEKREKIKEYLRYLNEVSVEGVSTNEISVKGS